MGWRACGGGRCGPVQRVLATDDLFADDDAFPVFADAPDLVAKVQLTAEVVTGILRKHGVELNFGEGKSNAVLRFTGQGVGQRR